MGKANRLKQLSLLAYLQPRMTRVRIEKRNRQKWLIGKFRTGLTNVRIEVRIPKRSRELKSRPPTVICKEDWMYSEDQWHNCKIKGLCWVLADDWKDSLSEFDPKCIGFRNLCGKWLNVAAANLIDRHKYGRVHNYKDWRKKWDGWGHHDTGIAEYKAELKKKNSPRIWKTKQKKQRR